MAFQHYAGLVLEALEELLGKSVLESHIVLLLDAVPVHGRAEGREGADAGAFGGEVGVCDIVAEEDGVVVGLDAALKVLVLLCGVGVTGEEDGVVLDAQLLCALVAAEVGGEHTAAHLSVAGSAELLLTLGDKLLGHHLTVDDVGVDVGKDVIAVDLSHVGLYAAETVAVEKELLGAAVEPHVAAQLTEALHHGGGQLVGGMGGDIGAAADVLMYHGGIVDEGQMLKVNTQIGPVSGQNVLALLGQLEGIENLLSGVGTGAEHIGIIGLKHLGVCLAGRCGDVGDTAENLVKELEKLHHLGAGAGDVLFHGVDEVIDAGGHGGIQQLAVGALGDYSEAVGAFAPVDLDTIGIQKISDVAGVFGRAEVAKLVEGGLNLKAASHKAGGSAAGQIVLLDEQGLLSRQLALQRRRQTGVTRAYDDYVIFCHICSPFKNLYVSWWLYQAVIILTQFPLLCNFFLYFMKKRPGFSGAQIQTAIRF